MRRQTRTVRLDPSPEGVARLREAIGPALPVGIDVVCGDIVLDVSRAAAGRLRVDGRALAAGRHALLGGERLRAGRRRLRLLPPAGAFDATAGTRTLALATLREGALSVPLPGPALVVLDGAGAGRRWPLAPGAHHVGRGLEADVVLVEPTVSRHHATIEVGDGEATITDAGSRHGTRVGRRRVRRPRRLSGGETLRLGRVSVRYLSGTPPAVQVPRTRRPEWWLVATATALVVLGGALFAASFV